jgi:preprotein translocase subunit SecE
MTSFFIVLSLLLIAVGFFWAADLSDAEYARRPEVQKYD